MRWPWLTLEVGQGFCIPRRFAGAYLTRGCNGLRHNARRFGLRLSVIKCAHGLTIWRVPSNTAAAGGDDPRGQPDNGAQCAHHGRGGANSWARR